MIGEDTQQAGDRASGSEPLNTNPTAERRGRRRRRSRGERDAGRRARALLPHLLTTGNLAAGFYAIIKASEGDFDRAAVAIIIAAVFDGLDGRVARMTRATSRFGAEYDSIADTVSFGVAPAILAFHAGAFFELGWTGWVMAFMFTACAALRLARFNVSPGRYRGRFEGLASPPAAGTVLATVLFTGTMRESGLAFAFPSWMGALGLAVLGLLMVSPIPYRSFKDVKLGGSYRSIVFMVIGFAVILMKPSVTLFLVGILYCSSGPIELYWRRRTGQTLVEVGIEETVGADGVRGETG